MLYNAETWTLTTKEESYISRVYVDLARRTMNKPRTIIEDEGENKRRESDKIFLANAGLVNAQRIMTYKKVTWLAHVIRGDDSLMKNVFEVAEVNSDDPWFLKLKNELAFLELNINDIKDRATDLSKLRKKIMNI